MKIEHRPSDSGLHYFFTAENQPNKKVQMGIITLQPGERSPEEGFACHEQDEFSYVIAGSAHTVLADGTDLVGAVGVAQLIEKGEKHWNYNDGDTPAQVVWFLVEREDED